MRYTERKQFPVNPKLFRRADTVTALRIHDEYVKKCSGYFTGRPAPRFFEVDRNQPVDPLWHTQTGPRLQFSRVLDIPAINYFTRNAWVNKATGLTPQRVDRFWLSHLSLMDSATFAALAELVGSQLLPKYEGFDYFPRHGDLIYWDGYRYEAVDVVLDGTAYWQQTNVWLGLVVVAAIVPDGDARPLPDLSTAVPAEMSPPPAA